MQVRRRAGTNVVVDIARFFSEWRTAIPCNRFPFSSRSEAAHCSPATKNATAQGRAGQGRAGQGRAGQGRAGQGRAGQGRDFVILKTRLFAIRRIRPH